MDVFDAEPFPLDDRLLAHREIVRTPHNAGQTPERMELLNAGVVDNVIAFLQGRFPNSPSLKGQLTRKCTRSMKANSIFKWWRHRVPHLNTFTAIERPMDVKFVHSLPAARQNYWRRLQK